MATQLPGRTDNEIKNYWNTRIKHRIRQGLPLYPHDIAPEHLPSSSVPRAMEPRSNTATQLHTQAPIQILTQPRHTSQDLPQIPSSMLLSPQYSQHYLKSSFNNGLFYPSPSLACPASTFTNTHTTPVLASSPLQLNGTYEDTSGFSLSFLPMSLGSSPFPSVPTPTQLPSMGSFQFSPLSCNVSSPQYVQTQLDSDRYLPSVSNFPSKSELPSSQLYLSQTGQPETDVKRRRGVYRSGSGLLEDLLEEAQALSNENPQTQSFMNLQPEKLDFSLRSGCDWDVGSSVNASAANLGHSHSEIDTRIGFGLPLAQEGTNVEKDAAQQIYSMEEEDFSKLLNAVPSTLQRGNLGHSTLDIDTCYASTGADITMGGLEMQQQIAPSLPASTAVDNERTPGPSSWDNLPGIC
ncbi:transcription factor MYB101-like [Rhodamnia argentea]|uniref:Transcription factor MYB101-like n=1 Tax=Rhodamnia argentea TaxID=178133 RepID=A0A8B8P513_9MYRT|nr:transcription factor MYB101-like [Rhodamnia argentea]